MEEQADIDMRKSLVIQAYLNMAACYIHLNHFSLALQCMEDSLMLSDQISQIYMRKAQTLSLRKDSSLADLIEAKQLMNKAISIKPT